MATRKSQQESTPKQTAVDTAYFNSDSGPATPPDSHATHPH